MILRACLNPWRPALKGRLIRLDERRAPAVRGNKVFGSLDDLNCRSGVRCGGFRRDRAFALKGWMWRTGSMTVMFIHFGLASAQLPALSLESLPRPATPPPERWTVVPSQV